MKQITIISEDRPGIVAEISEALANAGVNIESLDAERIGSSAVTILSVDRYDDALRALSKTTFKAITEDAILVKLDDQPGELAKITRRFSDANINLRSIRIVRRSEGHCIVAIATERTAEAMALVKELLIS